ncbi:MAG: hypothetical protein K1X92_10125 [Bacteroidia bacterium]|nr:hypothetical protein [Bacteroidia bacterium]
MSLKPISVITNPENLFGREVLLSQLVVHAKRGNNVQLIGLRRFGKTSLLKCLEFKLQNECSDVIFPIYFDFKDVSSSVKGTANVYRYITSRIIEQLTLSKELDCDFTIKGHIFQPSQSWEDVYLRLESVQDVKIQGIFDSLLKWFAEYLSKTFFFIFDEYEHMFRFAFDSPEGFMKMRTLSQQTLDNGQSLFSFIVSGTLTWEHLCTITGSGELNTIGETIFLPPIDDDSFKIMWISLCSNVEDTEKFLLGEVDNIFTFSGGVPFYAKLLGESWIVNNTKPQNSLLKPFFEEIFQSLKIEEQQILGDIYKTPKKLPNTIFKSELISKGLIKQNGESIEIKSSFFREYLQQKLSNINIIDDSALKIETLIKSISDLIKNINNTNKNKIAFYIFEPTNDDVALIMDLRTQCSTIEQLSNFANSAYKIWFERTKDRSPLDRLPPSFKRNNNFLEIIDIMRHSIGGGHLMDRFNVRTNQLTKADMLYKLTGSKNDPNSPDEFINIQIKTLELFESELIRLNTQVRT